MKQQLDGSNSWMEATVGWKQQLDGSNSWMEATVGWKQQLEGKGQNPNTPLLLWPSVT
jgi:hypothetical protein